MHVLDYLNNPSGEGVPEEDRVTVEYRLVSSGILYPAGFAGCDLNKSTGARILLEAPVELIVAGTPYQRYPQELALRFRPWRVEETLGSGSRSVGIPDARIARDVAALLSLLTRRLITVAGKVRQVFPADEWQSTPPCLLDWPVNIATEMRARCWPIGRPPPADTTSGNSSPAPVWGVRSKAFEGRSITRLLRGLPGVPSAEALVRSARLYALALELVNDRPEAAYQQLITCAETMGGALFQSYEPSADEKAAMKPTLVQRAKDLRLDEGAIAELVSAACEGQFWAWRKLKEFLTSYVGDDIWDKPDDLFPDIWTVSQWMPPKDGFEKALRRIYRARSGSLHSAMEYPATVVVGMGPEGPFEAFALLVSGKGIPPLVWFERVVNNALCNFLSQAVANETD